MEKKYIDLTGGIAVCTLGHSNKKLQQILQKQASELWHISNYATSIPTLTLAKNLCDNSIFDKVFFTNSGLEANEAALKLARRWAYNNYGKDKNTIIAFNGAFHGRSLFTVTAGGTDAYKSGFGPLPAGFNHLDINTDDKSIEDAFSPEICAVIVEPIFGEQGVIPIAKSRLQLLRDLCTKHNALLIFDEIQTGAGRTGSLFYYEQLGIKPDIITAAKGFANGLPIGFVLANDDIAQNFSLGVHGTTFGGNPLATAVANEVVNTVTTTEVQQNIANRHKQLQSYHTKINQEFNLFEPMRGKGLLIGWQFLPQWQPLAKHFFQDAIDAGVLFVAAGGGNVVRMAPSLLVTEQEIDEAMICMQQACKTFISKKI